MISQAERIRILRMEDSDICECGVALEGHPPLVGTTPSKKLNIVPLTVVPKKKESPGVHQG